MKTTLAKIILTFSVLLGTLSTYSQVEDPVSWSYKANKIDATKYELIITASIEEGWHLYSTVLPEGGPIPTKFTFSQSPDFKLEGTVTEKTKATKEHDEIFDLDLSYFANEAVFTQIIELSKNQKTTIDWNIEYQACFADKCIYLEKDLSITIGDQVEVKDAEISKPAISIATNTPEQTTNKDNSSLWVFFFIAFAAGLAGLLTPCVFPMIPMTVSFFMGKQTNRLNAILNALVFGISIIVIYTSLGLAVSLFNLGPDFTTTITTHWITNTIFFVLFIAFAASFFGLFEIVLPGNIANKTDSKADKGGFIGSFFMALTTVIVSLSCVGPIVGAILVEAASGLGAKPIIGMFGFSLAFSIPFTLFAIFPSWLNSLPKSGGWMNSVKIVLGFIVLAFSLKFLMTIDQSYNLNLLSRDIYLSIWIVTFILLGMYLLGKIKFKLDSELKHVGVFRLFLALASFSFAVYLVPGLFGAPLKSISGLLPPLTSQQFNFNNPLAIPGSSNNSTNKSLLCEDPKYSDFLHLPHGLQGYFDYDQALKCSKEKGKPLFIDFVGHSCANCKDMEAKVWSDPRVLDKLQNNYILVALYVDERKELPENEWVTSKMDGKVKKTIGKRNADFQISRFNINGQPYYVLLDSNEQLLAEPRGYNTDIEAFIQFLDKGIEEFNKRRLVE